MKRLITVLVLTAGVGIIGATQVQATDEKVTICHAAGQDDTEQYVTLTLSPNAVYGEAGHFNEDGTPQAGHENDYFGECETDDTTTTTEATTTTTVDEATTTTLETTTSSTTPTSSTLAPTTTVDETTSTSSSTTSSVPETSSSSVPPSSPPSSTMASIDNSPTTTPSSLPPILVSEIPEECIQRDGSNLPEGSFTRLSDGNYLLATGTARRIVTFCGPIVATGQPPVPTTTHTHVPAPPVVVTELPTTGTNSNIAWVALVTLLSGAFLTLVTRRRMT